MKTSLMTLDTINYNVANLCLMNNHWKETLMIHNELKLYKFCKQQNDTEFCNCLNNYGFQRIKTSVCNGPLFRL